MVEAQSHNAVNPKYIELMELLKQAQSVTDNKDKVVDRMRELLQQGDDKIMLKNVHPIFHKLEDFASVIDEYCKEFQGAYGAKKLRVWANEAHFILYKNTRFRKNDDSSLIMLCRKIEKVGNIFETIVKKMEHINDLYSCKYEVTDEQREQLQKDITSYLTDEGYIKIEVTIGNGTFDSTDISFTYRYTTPDEDADFSYFYDTIINKQLFDIDKIQAGFEAIYDWKYKQVVDYDLLYANIRRVCKQILTDIRAVELENFLDLITYKISVDLSNVAYRIETDFGGWLEYIDSKLTIEHVKSSKRLQQLLLGQEDTFEVYKGFPENSYILEDVQRENITRVLVENQNTGTAKAIMQDFLYWSIEKSDFRVEQNNIQDKLTEYIGDRFDEVQEEILKDHELTQKIIPEDNLFQVKDLWVFCP